MVQDKNNVTIFNCGNPVSNPDDRTFFAHNFDTINVELLSQPQIFQALRLKKS